ncbi:MAG: hypothetical protein ACI8U3_000677 [Brevundimonas sp.]|jgi:hypothetical protein|uniref:hypothetical protein n=1 Tax=Brevundimonas sp. TaxID=1871086 RepID=UPI0039E353D5
MTGPVRPVGPVEPRGPQRRTGDRRQGDERREGEPRPSRALVPSDEPPAPAGEPAPAPAPAPTPPNPVQPAVFAAQMIGQTGARKGLKGGPPVLGAARGSYLGTEYSGAGDRRPKPGKTTRTDI